MIAAPREAELSGITPQGLRAAMKAHLERLAAEVDATRRDGGFLEALRTMARFWPYSVFNQFSIWVQQPTASRVAGREAWASLGRMVTPGEAPIAILAPSRRRQGGVRFVGVEVFDVAQTGGRRLRSWSSPSEGLHVTSGR